MLFALCRPIRVLLLAAVFALTGCMSLSRNPPQQQHYILGSAAGVPRATTAEAPLGEELLVGLRLPRLADYLATPFMVVRRGTHQVEFSEYHRWGEPLGNGIGRTVAALLAERAPGTRVVTAPWPGGAPPDRVIQLNVMRFEGRIPLGSSDPEAAAAAPGPPGEAHLRVDWEILRPGDSSPLARGTTELREGGWVAGDFHGLVSLLDGGLRLLAEELANRLATLDAPPP